METVAERIVQAVVDQLRLTWPNASNGVRVTDESELEDLDDWITVLFDGDTLEDFKGISAKVGMTLLIEGHQLRRNGENAQCAGMRLIGKLKRALVEDRTYLNGLAITNQCRIESTSLRLPQEHDRAVGVAIEFSVPYTERYTEILK